MFERLTRRARAAVAAADAASRRLGSGRIGTEHQLLGLLAIEEGVAHDVLTSAGIFFDDVEAVVESGAVSGVDPTALAALGIDLEAVRAAVDHAFGEGALTRAIWEQRREPSTSFTPGAKKVMELALREALTLKHGYIGTEHLLLAMVLDTRSDAARIMRELAPDADIRRLIIDELSSRTP